MKAVLQEITPRAKPQWEQQVLRMSHYSVSNAGPGVALAYVTAEPAEAREGLAVLCTSLRAVVLPWLHRLES